MESERKYSWKVNLESGSCTVEATTATLLQLAQFDQVLQIHPYFGRDGRLAPIATCATCGLPVHFTVGWTHSRHGDEHAQWHTDPDGKRFCDFADHRAVPVFATEE